MKLEIKEEFKNLIPPLTSEEFKQLESNCLAEGIREPILTWQGFIIDGHNRYEIAQRWDLDYTTKEKQFDDEFAVKHWMLCNQLGRRNLTDEQKDYLIGKRYENDKQRLGGQISTGVGQNVPPVSTAEKLAEEYGISDRQVKRNEEFAKGVDLISKIDANKGSDILSSKAELTKGDVREFGKITKEIKKVYDGITEEEIEERAKKIAESKLQDLIEQKKNHYLKVANKIKESEALPQSIQNEKIKSNYNVKNGDVYIINGKHKLIVADAFEDFDFIKKQLPEIDCVLTDPPYGISYKSPSGSGMVQRGDYKVIEGDEVDFEPSILFRYADNVITWGANYYANKLQNSAGWLVWDKREGNAINNNSDCEMAWSNMISSARLFHHTWNGMIKASEKDSKRLHPTQKPIKLFQWCLEVCRAGSNILDLFAGSGTTIIACELTNRNAFVVEKDVTYASAILGRMELLGYKIEILL